MSNFTSIWSTKEDQGKDFNVLFFSSCLPLQATDGKEMVSDEVYGERVSTPVYV